MRIDPIDSPPVTFDRFLPPMRPVPHPDDTSTPTADGFASQALDELRAATNADIERAVMRALPDAKRSNEELVAMVIETVRERLPDEFDFETEYDDGDLALRVHSGCPHCGNAAAFHASIVESVQFVAYDRDGDDTICPIDDGGQDIEYIMCSSCGTDIYDAAEDHRCE